MTSLHDADDGRAVRRRRRAVRRRDRARAWPAARRSRCACRPAAKSACAYCIIPTTRGAARSLPVADVVARGRADRGGRLQGDRADRRAPRLVRPRPDAARPRCSICCARSTASRADVTFRVSSLEPMDCTPEIVDLVAGSGGRFAPHFHLPLQHASDRDARRDAAALHARRLPPRWSTASLARLPHASIGSDMIVGFPGRDRRRLRGEPRVPAGVAADAPARVPVFRSSGHRGLGDARQGARRRHPRARARRCARSARTLARASARAGRHDPARASRSRTARWS